MRHRRLTAIVAATAIVVSGLTVLDVSTAEKASAAVASQFNPGLIISDALFFDGGAMSASAVQNFLDSQVRVCSAGYTCLKSYRQDTPSKAADGSLCAAYAGAASETAASIIAKVGAACGISQKAILVLLQKEQGLVSAVSPTEGKYRSATGYGCPDTSVCDSLYYGFFNQVYMAALQFKRYAANPSRWNHIAGRVNNVRISPNAACGTVQVAIQNQATAGLYNYTPYTPNAAALTNLYGTGDSCSSYGNRNFWRTYTDWFGSTTTSTLLRSYDNATVYLVVGTVKHAIPDMAIYSALSPLGYASFVSQTYIDSLQTGAPAGRSIRDSNGTIYFIDSGIKLAYTSCDQVVDYGGSCGADGFTQMLDSQVAAFFSGPNMTSVLGTVEGSRYFIDDGIKHEILDQQSQVDAGIPLIYNVLTENAVSQLAVGSPIMRDNVVVTQRGGTAASWISGGKRWPITASDAASTGLSSRSAGALNASTIAQVAASGASLTGAVTVAGSPTVYVLTRLGRYTIPSSALSASLPAVAVPRSLVDGYSDLGALVLRSSMVLTPDNATVYVVTEKDLRPVISWDALVGLAGTATPTILTFPSGVVAQLTTGPVALAPGTMYRSPEHATVYLTNGLSNKIAFSSFSFPNDAGFFKFAFVSEALLSAYPTSSTLLTSGITCGGVNYVSANASIRAITPATIALFPFTFVPLDEYTCRQLTIGAPAIDFIRTSNGSIYQLVAGTKRPVTSLARLNQINGNVGWMQVSNEFATLIPTGPNA